MDRNKTYSAPKGSIWSVYLAACLKISFNEPMQKLIYETKFCLMTFSYILLARLSCLVSTDKAGIFFCKITDIIYRSGTPSKDSSGQGHFQKDYLQKKIFT